jgi:hypothetical protein
MEFLQARSQIFYQPNFNCRNLILHARNFVVVRCAECIFCFPGYFVAIHLRVRVNQQRVTQIFLAVGHQNESIVWQEWIQRRAHKFFV